ncbi:eukaryotic translation initiation factor 3 subunit A-like isoform X2 [Stegodyphus dumicola]|uniref:eukaryotic translation initiation factor 3 subunit A-like isoform X2 n=1 Tax=Stegodyphus dumicola TaxID=202533 RepID=UPI0015AF2DAC|nr:eukaryotic translation initiation factor 3 subunit A-like isoform X2 [Stegodyphus dumicola]
MGSDHGTGTRLAARFCYGACFGLGFVITAITLAAMFWIVWCYFGLAVLQISDSQRRAVVNYSHIPTKPSPTPVTASPSRATTLPSLETSVNSISKSPTVATVLRGSSRGNFFLSRRWPMWVLLRRTIITFPNRKIILSLFQELSPAATVSPYAPPRARQDDVAENVGQKAAILSGDESSKEGTNEEVIYARRVSSPTTENRPTGPDEKEDKDKRPGRRNPPDSGIEPRLDIAPTQVFDSKSTRSRRPLDEEGDKPTRDEKRSPSIDYTEKDRPASTKRDEIQSSRRSDDVPPYRDPDFERDYPRRPPSIIDRERSRYDDDDDTRGSRSRYDKRDRGRESDDRYSKGDTRVYPDGDLKIPLEKERTDRPISRSDDRYRDRLADDDRYRTRDDRYDDRYPDETRRRGDDDRYRDRDYDDRYRDRDERYRYRSVEEREKYRDKIPEDRYKSIDDKDTDRYRTREERYRYRDEDRYRDRDDDRYRTRDDDRLRDRIPEDKIKDRDYDYLSRDVSYRPRIDDDRYRDEEESRRRNKDYKEPAVISRTDEIPLIERRPLPVRSETSSRDTRRRADYEPDVIDRPRPYARDDVIISRAEIPVRSISTEDRYVARDKDEDYRRPSRIDERDDKIVPTRVRDDAYISRSSLVDDRSRDETFVPRPSAIDLKPRDETRFSDERKESRLRDDKYYDDDDRIRRLDDSRSTLSSPSSASGTRKLTRGDIPEERRVDAKYVDRGDEVKLDRRSYASEDDDKYRRSNSRTRIPYDYTDRDRRPTDERDYRDDDRYVRRGSSAEDEYRRDRTRTDYDTDRTRSKDRYDDEYRRYDRDDDRYGPLNDRSSSRKAETYPLDDDERYRRRELDERGIRKEIPIRDASDDRRIPTRPERLDDRPRKSEPDVRPALLPDDRRFIDSIPVSRNRDLIDAYPSSSDSSRKPPPRLVSSARDIVLSSSMSTTYSREPSDVIIREKRYQNSQSREKQSRNSESSRVRGELETVHSDRIMPDSKKTALRLEDSEERPLTAKDVIEAALRQSDVSSQNSRKVFYPVFDPRVSNLTSPEIIRPSERRGTTITAKKRRKRVA